jgi:hypothetical protein
LPPLVRDVDGVPALLEPLPLWPLRLLELPLFGLPFDGDEEGDEDCPLRCGVLDGLEDCPLRDVPLVLVAGCPLRDELLSAFDA